MSLFLLFSLSQTENNNVQLGADMYMGVGQVGSLSYSLHCLLYQELMIDLKV